MNGGVSARIAYTYADSDGTYGNAGPLGAPNTAYFQTRSETGYDFDTGEIIGEPLRLNLDDPRNEQPLGSTAVSARRAALVLSRSSAFPARLKGCGAARRRSSDADGSRNGDQQERSHPVHARMIARDIRLFEDLPLTGSAPDAVPASARHPFGHSPVRQKSDANHGGKGTSG